MKNKVILLVVFLIIIFITILFIFNNNDSYYVPDGFNIVEDNIDNGMIIKDENDNEFVWIPVSGIDISRKYYDSGKLISVNSEEAIDRIYFGEEAKYSVLYKYIKEDYKYSIEAFLKSINKYKGFYISRYEISEYDDKIASRKGINPLINITRDEALDKSINMYNNKDIVSSLINSYAWDIVLDVISKKDSSYLDNKDNTNKEIMNTGESNDIIYNIYDLSSNVSEWTTEYSNNGYYTYKAPCVERGNNYSDEYKNPVTRVYNGLDAKNKFTGFRVILYKY